MVMRMNTATTVPNFENVLEMVREVTKIKGIPFDYGKFKESELNFREKVKSIEEEIKKELSTKLERVGYIDFTARTKNRNHIINLICEYYEYPDTIFLNETNPSIYVTNASVTGQFKRQFERDMGFPPKLIEDWEELKKYNHAVSNGKQLNESKWNYQSKYPEKDGDLFYAYPDLNLGTTGRISASKPAMQALVDEYKECIMAPEGYKIVHMDVSGQEVHILMCGVMENATLLRKYIDLEDPYLAILETLELPKDRKHRELAKVPILGLMNGMGRHSIRTNMGESGHMADSMIDLIEKDKGYVGKVDKFVNSELRKPNQHRRGMFGTEFPVTRGGNPKTQIKNGFFQVTASEIMALTIQSLYQRMYEIDPTLGTMRLLVTIYDEYLFLIKDEFVEEGIEIIKNHCLPLVNNWPRFMGEVKSGKYYTAG